jgi:hypothetical protein
MNIDDQRICLWLVPIFGALLLIAALTFLVPPTSPLMSAQEVARFYREHVAQVRASSVVFNVCGIGFIPFYMVIVVQMQRMANPSRAFAYSYLSAAASGATMFALADLGWLIAAFRPERSPALTQLLNDMAWMAFITPVGFIMAQNLCLALSIYMDAGQKPIFPRWVGHFNVLTALLMAPGAFALMYLEGPLAWDGALAFWLRTGSFAVYIVVMFFVVRATLAEQERVQRLGAPDLAVAA